MTGLPGQAATQLADAAGYWGGRLEMYGLATVAPMRDARGWADHVVAQLLDDDPTVGAGAAQTCVEWASSESSIPEDWWDTPLGMLVASTAALGDAWVTQQQAADVLDVSRSTVARMIADGRLDTGGVGPTGGRMVLRSALATIAMEREQ